MSGNNAHKKIKLLALAPKSQGCAPVSVSLPKKNVEFIRRKAKQTDSSVSKVVQWALDLVEQIDSEEGAQTVRE